MVPVVQWTPHRPVQQVREENHKGKNSLPVLGIEPRTSIRLEAQCDDHSATTACHCLAYYIGHGSSGDIGDWVGFPSPLFPRFRGHCAANAAGSISYSSLSPCEQRTEKVDFMENEVSAGGQILGKSGQESQVSLIPPKWILEPRDVNVSAGHSLSLQCRAEGHPTPAITWKRATENALITASPGMQPGDYKDIFPPTGNSSPFTNGTVRFDQVRKSDEGNYLCEARNDVGSGLSKVIFLKVNG
ncbi:Down syndrome cell adhesion molecule-like protein Dscam2 [Folsomia candida]|uniref:Down syndrome cell adhesion molecule-like protein Dscam2 n=1 Tax=Folsomia candida TaxID=158441 RepID=A0A226DNB8_FOLCA|nr:Down syndrome cell adhesion molecule-like protein Dscam2 [Folsomia candida]